MDKKHYYFEFKNILSPESCEIDVIIKNFTSIDKLKIDCFGNCYLMITSKKISFNDVNIVRIIDKIFYETGQYVELNAPILISKNLSYFSTSGRFQVNEFDVEEFANISL